MNDLHPRRAQLTPIPADACAGLCVLASGSGGNCTVLLCPSAGDPGGPRRVILIDCGLSPRRTGLLLESLGIDAYEVDDILLTHLDGDHFHAGWPAALRGTRWNARLHMHRKHLGRAERGGVLAAKTQPFDTPFMLGDRVACSPVVMAHDSLGVAAFRMSIARTGAPHPTHLGFATDLGHITDELIDHMHGVDTLAIESNYCREMQVRSGRPDFLKRRIMGGAGHLSNDETSEAVARIGPREHVVFLHLSRQCNHPTLVSDLHAGGDYGFTIADQFEPTRWVWLRGNEDRPPLFAQEPASLFAGPFTAGPSA